MTQDTRKDPRAKIVSLNVRYKSATVDEFIENHSHDVSKGGIFIKTSTPFPQGTLLKFEIRLSGDQAVIAGVGRVVWKREAGTSSADNPAGMGVKFIKIDEASRTVIDKLVGTRSDAGSAFTSELPDDKPQTPQAELGKGTLLGPGAPAASTTSAPPRAGPAMKSTLIGMAAGGEPKAGSAGPTPAAGSPAATKPPPAASAGASVGAKTAIGGFFPATNSEADMPAPQERTMMKQAAELLEEALKGAGGSMDEVGTNPLFAGAAGATAKAGSGAHAEDGSLESKAQAPADKAGGDIATRTSGEPAPATSRESPAAKESDRPIAAAGDKPAASEPPAKKSDRPAATKSTTSTTDRPKPVSASSVVEPPKKGGSGALLWVAVLLLIGGGLVYAYKGGWLGGDSQVSTTPSATPSASAAPSASQASSAPSATQSAAPIVPIMTNDASALATGDAGGKKDAATAATTPTPTTTTAATAATTATPKPTPPRPTPPKPTETAPTATPPAGTDTTAPTTTAAPTAKPPKPKPTATDSDNPY
jgi:uncharacterized protein (TIGR02266 family)